MEDNKEEVCYYCGVPLTQSTRTIDHVLPLSRGGTNSKENKVLCCRRCNISKMDMTEEEFYKYIELKKKYKGYDLVNACREQGILLWTSERNERNKREKDKREWERKNKDGDKKLS